MATPENILDQILSKAADPAPEPASTEPEPATPQDPPRQEATPIPEPAEPATQEPARLSDLARKLDLTPEQLFAAVNSDGMSASEAFKAAKGAGELNADRELFETERNALRLEKASALAELSDYVAALPQGSIDETVMGKLREARGTVLEREQQLLLAAVPEWKDPAQKQGDVEAITGFISQFGLTPADLAAETDHRKMLMYRHVARQQSRLDAILSGAEKPAPKGQKKARQGKPAAGSGGKLDVGALVKQGLRQ